MAETYRSYNFTYGNTLKVEYETELGTVQIALEESGGKVQKTFPQKSPHPPYRRGDTFEIGPELDNHKLYPSAPAFGTWLVEVEECSVSDKPIGNRDGRNVDRIWLVSVSGKIRPQEETVNPLDGTVSDVAHTVGHSYTSKTKDGKTTRSGSLSLWATTPTSPYEIGDDFSPVPGGPSIAVTEISITDQVIGKALDGKLRRLWKISITGDEDSATGSTTVNYTFSRSKEERGYILIRGSMTKTSTSAAAPTMPAIGDSFTVPYVGTVICTKVSGTQEAPPEDPPTWSVTVEGAAIILGAEILPENDVTTEYSPNGIVTRDVAGNMVVLLRSNSPQKRKRITAYTLTETPLATQGGIFDDMIVTAESVVKENIVVDGVKVGTIYVHEIEVEY